MGRGGGGPPARRRPVRPAVLRARWRGAFYGPRSRSTRGRDRPALAAVDSPARLPGPGRFGMDYQAADDAGSARDDPPGPVRLDRAVLRDPARALRRSLPALARPRPGHRHPHRGRACRLPGQGGGPPPRQGNPGRGGRQRRPDAEEDPEGPAAEGPLHPHRRRRRSGRRTRCASATATAPSGTACRSTTRSRRSSPPSATASRSDPLCPRTREPDPGPGVTWPQTESPARTGSRGSGCPTGWPTSRARTSRPVPRGGAARSAGPRRSATRTPSSSRAAGSVHGPEPLSLQRGPPVGLPLPARGATTRNSTRARPPICPTQEALDPRPAHGLERAGLQHRHQPGRRRRGRHRRSPAPARRTALGW